MPAPPRAHLSDASLHLLGSGQLDDASAEEVFAHLERFATGLHAGNLETSQESRTVQAACAQCNCEPL